MAIVHLAMYDALAGVVGNPPDLPPYMSGLPKPLPSASAAAAVAGAAHSTLSHLYPSQKPFFDFLKDNQMTLQAPGQEEGFTFGRIVGDKLLTDRAGDPDARADGYTPTRTPGAHRADPDNPDQGYHAPFYGARSKGFAITKRLELDKPPQLDDAEYLKALREVRGLGIAPELMGTLPATLKPRTAEQTLIGIYWGYDGAAGLGTPPRLYNQIVRRLAIARGFTVEQNARLFALVNAALGDAGILAWDQKYIRNFWRPVVGVREHDKTMGPAAKLGNNEISDNCDPGWLPLGAPKTNSSAKNFTPPFPAYPSGHATFGAAALHITRLFCGVTHHGPDNLFNKLDFVSDEYNGVNKDNKGVVRPNHVRAFPDGLWQMIEENGRSRVFLGVHWIFDAFAVDQVDKMDLTRNIGGVPLGINIAENIFNHFRQAATESSPTRNWKSTVGPRA
jgi:vanadium chloroperoxidase